MIDRILKSLFRPAPLPLADADARLALTALLVRLARADNDYARVEIDTIERVIAERYRLSPAEAKALRAEAEALEAEAPDTVRFTQAIKDAVPYEQRLDVVESAWQVALADGARAGEEDALMRMVARLLGVNDRDSNLARQRAAAGRTPRP
ncbi:MAG: TerB family tellurite resistance protein [Alphaproteobacteria bacterium]|nr:MAG: TerB family tellurite resistance protein [Alphaproteobacteria bacterium]